MIVVGVIEDQWQDLLKAGANFLIEASAGAAIEVKLYLIAEASDVPQKEDIRYYEEELHQRHPEILFPDITVFSRSSTGAGQSSARAFGG